MQEMLAQGFMLKFLPPYSPDYNPIELVWNLLKVL
jgi:transposase